MGDNPTIDSIKATSATALAESKAAKKGWFETVYGWLNLIVPQIVILFEQPGMSGAEKKAKVLDLIEEVYKASGLDMPWVPQVMEIQLLRFICGKVIDLVVTKFNDSGLFKHAA